MLNHVLTHFVQSAVGIPLDPVPPSTPAVGRRGLTRLRPAEPAQEPPLHRAQLTGPRTDLSKIPTHNNTSDQTGHQSRQEPLQY